MSNYHPLWAAPTPSELRKGSEAIDKAKKIGARTEREKAYIEALDAFYRDADKLDHRTRVFAYHEAMKKVYQSNPSDREAGVFYALTLIVTGTMANDKTYVREKEAAKILNDVLIREPQHPGVTHYLIHSYDYPALALLALPAAKRYAKIAPASAHAREQLGELLLELNQASSALREFEVSRQSAPNRFNGLYGAARAAKLAGNQNRARKYYEKLLAISRAADTSRPELVEAKAFLANAGTSARR